MALSIRLEWRRKKQFRRSASAFFGSLERENGEKRKEKFAGRLAGLLFIPLLVSPTVLDKNKARKKSLFGSVFGHKSYSVSSNETWCEFRLLRRQNLATYEAIISQ